jgi:membrane protease YdiL (CAAX protease family)
LNELAKNLPVFLLTTVAVAFIRQSGLRGGSILVPAIWALGAWLPAGISQSRPTRTRPLKSLLPTALKYYILSSIIVFPLFGGGFFLYCRMGLPYPEMGLPPGVSLTKWIFYQFLFVGIFEELFFREYIYSSAKRIALPGRPETAWMHWVPIVYSALLFGIAHVIVDMNPAKFIVFFPGLLFAWLRARTGSLLAPVLSHGSSNVFYLLLLKSIS